MDDYYSSANGWRKVGKSKAGKSQVVKNAALVVLGPNGKTIYHCGKKKAESAKAGITSKLSRDSYTIKGNIIRLTEDLKSLGFDSDASFSQWCATLQNKAKTHQWEKDNSFETVNGTSRTDPKPYKGEERRMPDRGAACKEPFANGSGGAGDRSTVSKHRVRKKKWHRVEDEALRHQFALGETDMWQIKQAIPYRSNADIKLRIHELGLDQPDVADRVSEREALRRAWAEVMVRDYYETYGPIWSQWHRIVPWLGLDEVAALASTLDCDRLWGDADRERFLENEGADWTLKELNMFINKRPMLDDDDKAWSSILPGIGSEEHKEMLLVLAIPDKRLMDDLAYAASTLL